MSEAPAASIGEDDADLWAALESAATPEERSAVLASAAKAGRRIELRGDFERAAELEGVVLSSLRMRAAQLDHADLTVADLSATILPQASLRHVKMNGARLKGADLSHVDASAAQFIEADLEGVLAEEAVFDDAAFRFASLNDAVLEGARLKGADLHGASLNKADFTDVELQGGVLSESSAEDVDFSRADMRDASLARASLVGACFRDANLQGARFNGADLTNATLSGAQLQGVDLSRCKLHGAHWSGARLQLTIMAREQLGDRVGEEEQGLFPAAALAYTVLERNFEELGDHEAASWAYRRRRRMEKRAAGQAAVKAIAERQWSMALMRGARFMGDGLVEWLCDYGESVPRVLRALVLNALIFTTLYGLTNSVVRHHADSSAYVTHAPFDLLIFSMLSLVSPTTPAVALSPTGLTAVTLTAIEALIGIFLTGLLGFVAGNRIRR